MQSAPLRFLSSPCVPRVVCACLHPVRPSTAACIGSMRCAAASAGSFFVQKPPPVGPWLSGLSVYLAMECAAVSCLNVVGLMLLRTHGRCCKTGALHTACCIVWVASSEPELRRCVFVCLSACGLCQLCFVVPVVHLVLPVLFDACHGATSTAVVPSECVGEGLLLQPALPCAVL